MVAVAVKTQPSQDGGLQAVGVLVLIDQDTVELVADDFAAALLLQQAPRGQQQVVVIEDRCLLFAVTVGPKQLLQIVEEWLAPRECLGNNFFQWLLGTRAPAVDG